MSIPNPPNASRRHYRRWSDERIWREFYIALLPVVCDHLTARDLDVIAASRAADTAYAEYRKRFPIAAALEPDTDLDESTIQTKEGVQ